jgi:hypothetical protein
MNDISLEDVSSSSPAALRRQFALAPLDALAQR